MSVKLKCEACSKVFRLVEDKSDSEPDANIPDEVILDPIKALGGPRMPYLWPRPPKSI
jgi:hypothetical protein